MSDSTSVSLTSHPRYLLLEPKPAPARTGDSFQIVCPPSGQAEELLRSALSSRLVAVDFETRGSDYSLPYNETYIVGVGLAWDKGSCYLNPAELSDEAFQLLADLLVEHEGLLAHNVYFDGGWIRRDLGQHARWYACTYGLFMQLANEGWEGQRWSLKVAMTDVLLWSDTNEKDLDDWLVANGYKKSNNAPMKEEMWRAPADILGKYCVLDAEATYLLMTEFFEPVMERFPAVLPYHQDLFLPHVEIHIDQKMHGIMTDPVQWQAHKAVLDAEISALSHEIRTTSSAAEHIYEWEKVKYLEFLATEPARYLKQKERKEPAQYLKDGVTVSKNWLKWKEAVSTPPTESAHWTKWNQRKSAIESGLDENYLFNLNSGDQLRWLLYDKLGNKVNLLTDSGKPAVGEDALKGMGQIGKLFIDRTTRSKELTYLDAYLEFTKTRPTVHPSFKLPGTVTGRLSGKDPNLQQMPKTKGTLSGFISRKYHSFVDCDVNALEMVVTAELSQDDNLLALYGPNATWPSLSTAELCKLLDLHGIRYRILANGDMEVCDEDL